MNGMVIALALCLACFVSGVGIGYHRADKVCNDDKLELAAQVAKTKEAQDKVVTKIVTKYVNITREIPVYAPSENNTCTVLDGNFRLFHDGAAGYIMPATTGSPDAAPVHIEEVAAAIAFNYHGCSQNADQLSALQEWAKAVSQ